MPDRRRRRRRAAVPPGIVFLGLLLTGFLLTAGGAAAFLPDSLLGRAVRNFLPFWEEAGEDWTYTVAYVPLDDRTDNLQDVELLAEASGWRVVLPERDWFHTALDGQPRNANGSASGNREALLEWVQAMDEAGCNRFLLSLDQLLSGGLVNSRSLSEPEPLFFPDGTVLDEAEAFRQYILPLAEDPENRVYLFDSVVRLSPTVGYRGLSTEEYYALREYGMVERPALEGKALTPDNIFALYPYAADGFTPAEDALGSDKFREYLTDHLLSEYLSVRRRKLSLLDSILTDLASVPGGNVELIIGVDDSSNTENIQYNELRYLGKRLGEMGSTETAEDSAVTLPERKEALSERTETLSGKTETHNIRTDGNRPYTRIMAGLDSLARLLLGRMARAEYGNVTVRTSVRYIGGTEARHSSEFDLYTLEEVVDLHLDLFGAARVPEKDAELQFVVMTAPDDTARADEYREELISLLEDNIRRGVPTVLDEASNNAYGDALEQDLLERVNFAGLAAFAGKYDQANVTGAAFAMGFSRYLYLQYGRDPYGEEQAAERADSGLWDWLPWNHRNGKDSQGREDMSSGNRSAHDTDSSAYNTDGSVHDADNPVESAYSREDLADLAQIRQLAASMALTEYILHVRAPLNEYVEDLGLNYNNMSTDSSSLNSSLTNSSSSDTSSDNAPQGAASRNSVNWNAGTREERVLRKLRYLFRTDLRRVCENLKGSRLLTLDGEELDGEGRIVGNVEIRDLHFPWNRTFEVAFDVEASLADSSFGEPDG